MLILSEREKKQREDSSFARRRARHLSADSKTQSFS